MRLIASVVFGLLLFAGVAGAQYLVLREWSLVYSSKGMEVWCTDPERARSEAGKPVIRYFCWVEEEAQAL